MLHYQEVYNALSFHEWRDSFELREIIASQKRINEFRVNIGTIYVHLKQLCDEGYADRREREVTPERLEARGGHKPHEFKLTEDGLRKRIEMEQQSTEGIEATLNPAKA